MNVRVVLVDVVAGVGDVVAVAQPVEGDAVVADGVPQMPLFALLVEKLVQLFVADETLVVFRLRSGRHRCTLAITTPVGKKRILKFFQSNEEKK